jgi:hypothetical protein
MAIPAGQLTRGSIVSRATRKAGNTQLAAAPDYEAQIWLNQILYDLYTQFDWAFTRTTDPITFSGQLFSIVGLTATFSRPANDIALMLTSIDGAPAGQLIREVDRRTFDLLNGSTPGLTTTVPDVYTVIYESFSLAFYPTCTSTITANFTYQFLPAQIPIDPTGDATIPTFPWGDYLIQALFVAILEYEMDGRADNEAQKRELMLRRIRNIAFPSRSAEPTIPLDVNVFSRPFWGDEDWTWLRR